MQLLAGNSVQSEESRFFPRPDAGNKVYLPVGHNQPTSDGADGTQSALDESLPVRQSGVKLPQQRPLFRIQAVAHTVVSTEVDLVLPGHRRQPDRPIGIETPLHFARLCIQSRNGIIVRRTKEKRLPHHNGLIVHVEPQMRKLAQPGRDECRILP